MYRIEPFAPYQMPLLLPLLQSYGYKPYRAYVTHFGSAAIERLFIAKIDEALLSQRVRAICALAGEEALGIAVWGKLEQDSRYLGFSAARLDYLIAGGDYDWQCRIKQALLEELLSQCVAEGIHHLSARVDAADLSSIHSLEKQGFITVDGLLTYSCDLRERRLPSPPRLDYEIRLARSSDIPELMALAR
ncbi:MAG: hypothetical protein QXP01_09625, partial [Candidatus Hadarchaeum sp.]